MIRTLKIIFNIERMTPLAYYYLVRAVYDFRCPEALIAFCDTRVLRR